MKKNRSVDPVWMMLRHNVSVGQLIGYGLANMIGLAILLTAMQFYRDVRSAWSGDDPMISSDYLILSKTVKGGLAGMLDMASGGNGKTEFSDEEIAELEKQPWCKKVGRFTAAECNVSASVDMGGRGLSTYLFLESIPDDFFDVRPRGWGFQPGKDKSVPIIISKDYLALYNFGFAPSRGMPQISEGMVSIVPLRLSLSGNGRSLDVKGKIVGFSSRLNTIAVPQEFMEWVNSEFSDGIPSSPSRIIVETAAAGDPEIERYLEAHGYESAGDKVSSGRAAFFLRVLTGVVGVVGALISLLSFFILLLSIWLLLQKNREKLSQLLMLGYSPAGVARYYDMIVCCVNVAVFIGAVAMLYSGALLWRGPLGTIGISSSSLLLTLLTGAGLMALVTILNIAAIHRKMVSFLGGDKA